MTNELTISKKEMKRHLRRHGKKFLAWAQAFLDPESETYGNSTRSALATYNCKNYGVGASIGWENLKKLENLGIYFSEQQGVTIENWFKILSKKALEGSYTDVKDYLETIGVLKKSNQPLSQNNFQFNFSSLAEEFIKARQARGLPVDNEEKK